MQTSGTLPESSEALRRRLERLNRQSLKSARLLKRELREINAASSPSSVRCSSPSESEEERPRVCWSGASLPFHSSPNTGFGRGDPVSTPFVEKTQMRVESSSLRGASRGRSLSSPSDFPAREAKVSVVPRIPESPKKFLLSTASEGRVASSEGFSRSFTERQKLGASTAALYAPLMALSSEADKLQRLVEKAVEAANRFSADLVSEAPAASVRSANLNSKTENRASSPGSFCGRSLDFARNAERVQSPPHSSRSRVTRLRAFADLLSLLDFAACSSRRVTRRIQSLKDRVRAGEAPGRLQSCWGSPLRCEESQGFRELKATPSPSDSEQPPPATERQLQSPRLEGTPVLGSEESGEENNFDFSPAATSTWQSRAVRTPAVPASGVQSTSWESPSLLREASSLPSGEANLPRQQPLHQVPRAAASPRWHQSFNTGTSPCCSSAKTLDVTKPSEEEKGPVSPPSSPQCSASPPSPPQQPHPSNHPRQQRQAADFAVRREASSSSTTGATFFAGGPRYGVGFGGAMGETEGREGRVAFSSQGLEGSCTFLPSAFLPSGACASLPQPLPRSHATLLSTAPAAFQTKFSSATPSSSSLSGFSPPFAWAIAIPGVFQTSFSGKLAPGGFVCSGFERGSFSATAREGAVSSMRSAAQSPSRGQRGGGQVSVETLFQGPPSTRP